MPYDVVYDSELRCLLITTEGELDMSSLAGLPAAVHPILERESCTRILHDLRQATLDVSTIDIYDLPAFLQRASALVARARRALVVRADMDPDDFQFFKTVSRNQGQNVRLFTDMEEAKHWLEKGDSRRA